MTHVRGTIINCRNEVKTIRMRVKGPYHDRGTAKEIKERLDNECVRLNLQKDDLWRINGWQETSHYNERVKRAREAMGNE